MRTIILLILLSIVTLSNSQVITNYGFGASSGTFTEITDGTTLSLSGGDVNNGYFNNIPIGFTFYYLSLPYTSLSATTAGYVVLGQSLSVMLTTNDLDNGISAANPRPVLAPLWDWHDIQLATNFSYKTITDGSDSIFIAQWRNLQWTYNATGNTISFQLRLYKNNSKIEFIYRRESGSVLAGSASIGISGGSGSSVTGTVPFLSLDGIGTSPTASSTTETESLGAGNTKPATGQAYSFLCAYNGTPVSPSNLIFSGVDKNNITVSWTDNSINESYFKVTSALDAGFSRGIVEQIYNSSTSVGTGTSYNHTFSGLPPGTLYYFKVVAGNEASAPSTALSGTKRTTSPDVRISAASGNWNSTGTWTGGIVPGAEDSVVIANSHTVTINTSPICLDLIVGNGTSGSLTFDGTSRTLTVKKQIIVKSGATLSAGSSNITHIINLGGTAASDPYQGNLTVDGSADFYVGASNGKATLNFFGISDGAISGTGTTCDFDAIVVNKGTDPTPVLEVQRTVTMQPPSTTGIKLTITAGTFKLSSNSSLQPYFGSQTPVATNGRLWLNHPSCSVQCVGTGTGTGAGNPTVQGILQITAGTFGYGSGNNNIAISGRLIMDGPGATFNIYGRLTTSTATSLSISGGNINVDPQVGTIFLAANDVVFINASCQVNFTGGTLTIVDPNKNNNAFYKYNELEIGGTTSVKNFSGSTIRFGDGTSTSPGSSTSGGFTILAPEGVTLDNVVINNNPSGNYRAVKIADTLNSSCTINNLTITAGSLNLNDCNLNVTGNLSNSGIIDGSLSGSMITMQGTSAQSLDGTFTSSTLKTLNISNTSDVTLNADLTVNNITISAGKLKVAAGKALTNATSLNCNTPECIELLTPESHAATGSLLTNGSINYTNGGTIKVNRYITGENKYHFISSPVSNATAGSLFAQYANYIWVRSYTESTNSWANVFSETILNQGSGYSVYMNAVGDPNTATFTGQAGNGTITVSSLARTASPGSDGYHLLGNPYPSAIDWDLVTKTNVDATVWVWPYNGGNYINWNGSIGGLTDGIVPMGQGFFVHVNSSPGSVGFENADRLHSAAVFQKSAEEVPQLLSIKVTNQQNDYYDKVFINYNPEATSGFDTQFDGYKLNGLEEAPELYTMGTEKLSINVLKSIAESPEIDLGFKAGFDGQYTFTAEGMESFPFQTPVYLVDKLNNTTVNLRETPVYSFNSPQGFHESRFKIAFTEVGVPEILQPTMNVFYETNRLHINLQEPFSGEAIISNLMGQIIYRCTLSDIHDQHIMPVHLVPGVYIIKLHSPSASYSSKIIIK